MQTLPVRDGGGATLSGRRERWNARRAPRWWAPLAAAVLLLLDGGASVQQATAYEFLTFYRIRSLAVMEGADALRWDPAVWGPGEMAVVVPDDPDWLHVFADMDEVRDMVAGVLRDWSEIDTADIRWSMTDISAPRRSKLAIRLEDMENTGAAFLTTVDSGIGGLITGCRVAINRRTVRSGFPAGDILDVVSHELGHCLGLDHTVEYLTNSWTHNGRLVGLFWGPNGPLSRNMRTVLPSADNRFGVSLLRPASSWAGATGGIYGTVLGEGFPVARHVTVLATRRRLDGSMGDGVMRFTGYYGEFAIDGLPPGAWFLMVYSLRSPYGTTPEAQKYFNVRAPTIGVTPMLHLAPIEVRAGQRTGPVVLTVRSAER